MTDVYYIQAIEEDSAEAIELPLEEDQTLDLATLQSQFRNAIGLKYKAETGAWRALKVNGESIVHPEKQWSDSIVYVVVFPKDNKRKAADEDSEETPRTKKIPFSNITSDLVVLNMPYDITEDDMKIYFEKFGETVLIQLKKKPDGSSRGFGFIKFKKLEEQKLCVAQTHKMGDRVLEVKTPQSKAAGFYDMAGGRSSGSRLLSRRIHVGNVTAQVTRKDLEDYFGKFGTITDIFVPKPTELRKNPMYAFLTYAESNSAETLINSDLIHKVNGENLTIDYASPINKDKQEQRRGGSGGERPSFTDRGTSGDGKPKNKSEAMGMAMDMMKQWMDTPDDEGQRGYQGRGSERGGGVAGGYQEPYTEDYHGSGTAGNYGNYGGYNSYGSSYGRPSGYRY